MISVKGDDAHVAVLLGLALDQTRSALLVADPSGLRVSQLRVVTAVPEEGCRVTELAELLAMTKQGCGQLVAALVTSGHLSTAVDPADARVRVVRRTASGDVAVEAAAAVVAEVERAWARRVGEQRYADFRAVLAEIGEPPAPRSTRGPARASGTDLPTGS